MLTVDVGRARRRHGSLQEAAREARLEALAAAAARSGCTKIALGHTADDQAETILFRILRGTGIAGLAGMAYQRGSLIRPLLDVRRAQILRYLGRRKLPFVTDPSNANRRYARVRIRHEVLPFLARENPRVVEALLQLGAAGPGDPGARLAGGAARRACTCPSARSRSWIGWRAQGRGTRRVAVAGGAIVVAYGQVRWESGRGHRSRHRRWRPYACGAPASTGWPRAPALAVDIRPPLAGPPPVGQRGLLRPRAGRLAPAAPCATPR